MALRGYRQRMWIMHLMFPITTLHWGPAALWFHLRHGRRTSLPVIEREGEPDPETGICFQRFTIAPMRDIGSARGAWAMVKTDTFSITPLQTGLLASRWVYQEALSAPGLAKTTVPYRLLIQLTEPAHCSHRVILHSAT
ncbi:hypothetical protein [Streptomyces sp. NPDC088794]|uniref:hypothetical protein n=1 Tax=Streptomyces sp. NPDC088794 TaxID=3365902 RepID=UPI0038297C66